MNFIQSAALDATSFTNDGTDTATAIQVRTNAGSKVKIAIDTAITAALAGLPADKFLQGLGGYNAATNVLTLNMSDGSTVNVDMSSLVTDAVNTALAGKVPFSTNGGVVIGYLLAP